METWTVAGVQMDCRIADVPGNLATVRHQLRAAAGATGATVQDGCEATVMPSGGRVAVVAPRDIAGPG